ncbi:MAG: N-acetylmuramic acid 6-phosphate etherase [Candidatus Eremiobacteraeota bacterium]|nr:N-acetylmuramic acid 6-phosphate etherase [Candidatus Eremiobacteraeota bacterium]MBC5827537.1 N-acetylmuramic acid 6-phosphate etherase [Candidatus Eremiobacteraeota bacterium]
MAEPLTEQPNASSADLDQLGTREMLHRINDEDRRAAWAVEREIDVIAAVVDQIAERLQKGGRLHYFGAGTSGRLAVLDAAEIPPTFSTAADSIVAHIAGGVKAVVQAVEGAEDDTAAGANEAERVRATDAVICISASGTAPYVLGALRAARARGALTIGMTNSPGSPLALESEIAVVLLTGPEVIAGSTRMKAGSAQKMALNMISTAAMVKLGKVYANLMVDVKATNRKLRSRAQRLTCVLTGVPADEAERTLDACGWQVKTAVVMLHKGCDAATARALLDEASGFLREVVGPPDIAALPPSP